MDFKKTLLVFCLIMCILFTVSNVAAGDVNDTMVSSDNANQVIEETNMDDTLASGGDELIAQTDNDEILSEKDDGTFTALQNKIDAAAEGSTITLENDYKYNDGFSAAGIKITKSLTIDGNGHKIDADGYISIFKCNNNSNKIILNNIDFYNAAWYPSGRYDGTCNGGAIYSEAELEINNCNFIKNEGYLSTTYGTYGYGGAIYSTNTLILSNCKFEHNRADSLSSYGLGGAIYCKGNTKITNCIFNENSAGYNSHQTEGDQDRGDGGAIYNTGVLEVHNSKFTKNKASYGKAIYNSGTLKAYDSTFSDKQSESICTSIYSIRGAVTKLSNCKFYEPILTAKAVTKIYGTSTKLVVYLKDNEGNAIANAKVNVNLANKVTPITTNSKGQATMAIGQAPGTYYAKITYPEAKQGTVKIVVKKATPKLTAAKKTFKRTAKFKNYAVVLKTNKNKALKAAWVSLKVNKKTYKVKTNAKGQAIFKINNLAKKGTFNAVVKFAGNKYYNTKTVKAKITIK